MIAKILEIKEKAERDILFAQAKLSAIDEILAVVTPTETPCNEIHEEPKPTEEVNESCDFNQI
jgi:hypothetical protein